MILLNNTKIEIYQSSKINELNIIKPEIQRIIDNEKVVDIVKFQLDFYKQNGFFNFSASGPINIHNWDNQHLLVDGQHRIEALEKYFPPTKEVI